MTASIRDTYLATARAARPVLAHPEVGRRWDEPSALAKFTIRGLSGHLVRAVGSTIAYLDRGEPDGPAIDAVSYYAQAVDTSDVDAALNVAVRERGEAEAEEGHAAL
ncbi:MAG: maleylpyruvate isomerase N-terminal domain-containing protein, partial [Actinomycetota bacterium]|nr:maleylpyruvate isomerase N-terminal domain-containing protein [Actinomycetota bacterium]